MSVGMPRPSSLMLTLFSVSKETSIFLACPAIASSKELSKTSHIKWCSPSTPVEPIYIPGLFRTGSKPSKTWISLAEYDPPDLAVSGIRTGDCFLSFDIFQTSIPLLRDLYLCFNYSILGYQNQPNLWLI